MIALTGTPCGSSHAGSIVGHCDAGAVKREFGCAAFRPQSGVQFCPVQSTRCAGGSPNPSHHTSPSSVRATFVKMVLARIDDIAFGLLCHDVPGATPK